ncbi:MAG: hypothetical protein AABX31_05960 [Nanoarchaeota archaeon]
MKSGHGFLRKYLYIVIIIALIGISDAMLTFLKVSFPLYARIIPLVLFLFFFFNIFAIAIFRRHQVGKIVYVLPIYYIISYLLFLSLGLYLVVRGIIPTWLSYTLIGIQAAFSLFELSFSVYLLMKTNNDLFSELK